MKIGSRSILSLLPVLAASVALLAGCGDPEVAKADVENIAMKQLSASVGKESPPISCPGNLKAKPGSSMICAISLDGKTHDVSITVTTIEGSTANFTVEVADKPRS